MSDSFWPHDLYSPLNFLGQNTAVGSPSLLQGIFSAQGSNPGLPHCRQILYQRSQQGSPLRSYRTDFYRVPRQQLFIKSVMEEWPWTMEQRIIVASQCLGNKTQEENVPLRSFLDTASQLMWTQLQETSLSFSRERTRGESQSITFEGNLVKVVK